MNTGDINCPFCNNDISQRKIKDGNLVFSVYDKYPVNKGHILVITKRHCSNYFLLSEAEKSEAWQMISEMEVWVRDRYNPDGFNIGINVSEAAGQTVQHVHIHLIPRYIGDMKDPTGGIRHCVENKGYYSKE
jgi:diadenosine tetraphosphate (Ap4A) HIT family hydrolase